MLVFVLWLGVAPAALCQPATDQNTDTQQAEQTPERTPVDERFDSPRSTMFTYLEAMATVRDKTTGQRERDAGARLAMQCFDWGAAGEPDFHNASTLLEVLNKIEIVGRYELPGKAEADSRGLSSFTYFPQERSVRHARVKQEARGGTIVLERTDSGEWKFSTETVDGIQSLRNALDPLPSVTGDGPIVLTPSQWVRSRVPHSLKSGELLTLEYWQWVGLAVLIFVGLTLDTLTRGLISGVWRFIMRRRGREAEKGLLRRAVRPFGLIVAAAIWYWGLDLVGLPTQALAIIRLAVRFFLMVSSVWAAWRATDLLAEFLQTKAERSETKFDDLLVPLVRKTVKVLVTALGLVYIANALRIEILPLLTGLGIGGVAVAFAAKDTIENFFGSVAVMLDRPFEVGDWIVVDDVEGTVEELGFRSTRIRTFYNSQVTVPNATLVRAKVDNYGRRKHRRFKTTIGLTYDTPPDKIEAFCEGVREIIRLHPYTRKDYFHVWLNGFGASSLDVLVYIFHDTPDWATELRERQRFMLDVIRLAERVGVEFAFPTQTLHIAGEAAQAPGSPGARPVSRGPRAAPAPDTLAELRARVSGRRSARDLLANASWADGAAPPPVSFGADAIPDDLPMSGETAEGGAEGGGGGGGA